MREGITRKGITKKGNLKKEDPEKESIHREIVTTKRGPPENPERVNHQKGIPKKREEDAREGEFLIRESKRTESGEKES